VGELKDSSIPVVLRGFEIISSSDLDLKMAQDEYPAGEAYALARLTDFVAVTCCIRVAREQFHCH